jgi:hypothetical protein
MYTILKKLRINFFAIMAIIFPIVYYDQFSDTTVNFDLSSTPNRGYMGPIPFGIAPKYNINQNWFCNYRAEI